MSRKSKKGVLVPSEVNTSLKNNIFTAQKGSAFNTVELSNNVKLITEEDRVFVKRVRDTKQARSDEGLYHALILNAVVGVDKGFEEKILLTGVGYRMQQKGKQVELQLGYSHPIVTDVKESINLKVESPTELTISGSNLQEVTQAAAMIIKYRSAKKDPYKQKGAKRPSDLIRKKQGKKVK